MEHIFDRLIAHVAHVDRLVSVIIKIFLILWLCQNPLITEPIHQDNDIISLILFCSCTVKRNIKSSEMHLFNTINMSEMLRQ